MAATDTCLVVSTPYSAVTFADAWADKRGCGMAPGKAAPLYTSGPDFHCKDLCCSKPGAPLQWCPLEGGTHEYGSPRYALKGHVMWWVGAQ
jgi:hypothetical protein